MRREVRCCCDPGKLLGSMDVPPELYGEFVAKTVGGEELKLEVANCVIGKVAVIGRTIVMGQTNCKAIKSNDCPIEKLKEIPTFREA